PRRRGVLLSECRSVLLVRRRKLAPRPPAAGPLQTERPRPRTVQLVARASSGSRPYPQGLSRTPQRPRSGSRPRPAALLGRLLIGGAGLHGRRGPAPPCSVFFPLLFRDSPRFRLSDPAVTSPHNSPANVP